LSKLDHQNVKPLLVTAADDELTVVTTGTTKHVPNYFLAPSSSQVTICTFVDTILGHVLCQACE